MTTPGAGATLLVLGNYRPTLAVARGLAPRGWRVIVTRGGGEGCAEYSRHVAECWDHPPIEDEAAFVAALARFLERRPDVRAVLPVWEPCVLALARHQAALPADRVYATPAPDVVVTCLDKARMLEIAAEADLPCAPYAVVDTWRDLVGEAARLGFPVVVRPLSSARPIVGRKALVAESAEVLRAAVPSWPAEQDRLIVQRFVAGPRHNVYFAAVRGRPIRLVSTRTVRTHVADGTGLAVEARTVPLTPELQEFTARIAARLDYHGVGLFQVLGEPGRLSFLELNPRVGANLVLAEASGLELGHVAIEIARGAAGAEPCVVGRADVRCAWTYGELRAIKVARGAGGGATGVLRALGRALATGLRADVHLTWDRRDPLPTLALVAKQVPGLAALLDRRTVAAVAGAAHPAPLA